MMTESGSTDANAVLEKRIQALEAQLAKQATLVSATSSENNILDIIVDIKTEFKNEGFKLIWAGYFEQNSWLKALTLWEIRLVTATSEDLQLWEPPMSRIRSLISTDPKVSFAQYISDGCFRNDVLFKEGFEKKVSKF